MLPQLPTRSLQQLHLTLRHAATALPIAPADVARLDVTQRAVHDRVVQWARVVQGPLLGTVTPAPLRLVVLGTAGTGKSDTLRATVASVETLWGAGKIVRCAHTGVAAFNVGAGAETINSLFMLNQELRMAKTLDAVVERLSEVRLLIFDEVSMVPRRSASELLRVRCGGSCADRGPLAKVPTACGASQTTLEGSAGLASCLWETSGRFPPMSQPGSREAAAGQRLFRSLHEAIRLRRVYRQRGRSEFKDSTAARWRRVRGGRRFVGAARPRPEEFGFCDQARARGGGPVAGVSKCKSGEPQRRLAEVRDVPLLAFEATHNNDMAAKRPSEEFSQLRSRVHLGIGAQRC